MVLRLRKLVFFLELKLDVNEFDDEEEEEEEEDEKEDGDVGAGRVSLGEDEEVCTEFKQCEIVRR